MGDVSVGMIGGRWGRKAEFACRKSESNEQLRNVVVERIFNGELLIYFKHSYFRNE